MGRLSPRETLSSWPGSGQHVHSFSLPCAVPGSLRFAGGAARCREVIFARNSGEAAACGGRLQWPGSPDLSDARMLLLLRALHPDENNIKVVVCPSL